MTVSSESSGDSRETQRIQRRLTEAASEWSANNNDPGFLYRGALLAATEKWAQRQGNALNELERAFLAASSAERERIAREQEAQLEAQKAQLEAQQALVDQLTGERDYLRQALATVLSKILHIKTSPSPADSEAESPQTKSLVYISYSHKDEKEKDQLLSYLAALERPGLVELWRDDRIEAGADWEMELNQAISQAAIAILLITENFLRSDFILETEVPSLLKRRQDEGLIIYPIIAKPCQWRRVGWLANMSVRPKTGSPIWDDDSSHIDKDLSAITAEVVAIVQSR